MLRRGGGVWGRHRQTLVLRRVGHEPLIADGQRSNDGPGFRHWALREARIYRSQQGTGGGGRDRPD